MDTPLVFHPRRAPSGKSSYPVSTTPEVETMLHENCVVAIGVSGGKDGASAAIRLSSYLDEIGHAGARVLIHSDLGTVEWKASMPECERLAKRLGWELIVVRRNAGGMMQRWESRWENNVARYAKLECVKLILPWSTPSMRFCTSELKTQIICAELTRRFPGQKILSVTGIRHDESSARSKMPVASKQEKLSSRKCSGLNWNPIITWTTPEVFSYLDEQNEPLHEAYTKYGSTRVSCAFCIMGSIGDLNASASCPDNADIYRRMVELEVRSTYAFQGSRWLGDLAPALLSHEMRTRFQLAKIAAQVRVDAEARLPKELLYTAGWPTSLPSLDESRLIAEVRVRVADAVGIEIGYTDANSVRERYVDLLDTAGVAY